MARLVDVVIKNNETSINTKRNIRPDKPKGYLVKSHFYEAPVDYFKDLAKDSYCVVKGWKGQANDHELGRQNDAAMKLGSLGIAAYLMTFRKAKLPKLMELVGFGSFFASMALWPKLAISLPLKLRTGVDIQQKYVDSYGRKKGFFQDPQYLAWDLYSQEQLDKMGKKMGVPLDVPNRNEVIQEKARKLAVQGNTLWMLTAGFATPVMTALISNKLEPVVETLKQKYDLKTTQRAMDSQSWFKSSMAAPKEHKQALEEFLTENMGSKVGVSDKLISKLYWTTNISPEVESGLRKDMENILGAVKNDIAPDFVDNLYETFGTSLKKANVNKEDLTEVFKNGGLFGKQADFIAAYKEMNPGTTVDTVGDAAQEILQKLIDKKASSKMAGALKEEVSSDKMRNMLADYNGKILDAKTADKIRAVFNEVSNYYKREDLLQNWLNARVADNADSMSAYSWKRVTNEVFSAMGLSGKDLKVLKSEGPKSKKLLIQKFEELAKDPVKYKKVVTKIANKIAEFDAVADDAARQQYFGYVDTMCDLSRKGLKDMGLSATAEAIGGRDLIKDASGKIINAKEALSGSMKNAKKILYDERVLGERASFYRLLQTMDLFKRIEDGTLEGQFKVIEETLPKNFKPNYAKVVKMLKETLVSAGSAEHTDKLGLKGTTNTYKTIMKLLYGALPEEYVQQTMVDLSTDVMERRPVWEALENGIESGYKAAVEAGFDKVGLNKPRTGFTKETLDALYDASVNYNKKNGTKLDIVENVKTYMKTFIKNVVNFDNGRVRGFNLEGQTDLKGALDCVAPKTSPSLKQALIGLSTEDFYRKGAQELFNTKKWFKMFGIGGAVLLAGTVLTTLFFGHLPQNEMYMKDGNKK